MLQHKDEKQCTSGDSRLCLIDAAYTQNTNPEPCQRGFGRVYRGVSHVIPCAGETLLALQVACTDSTA
jgi:hypothetical protein